MSRPISHVLAVVVHAALACSTLPTSAQQDAAHGVHSDASSEHVHPQHEHDHDHALEIGLAPGIVFLPSDSAFAFGLHLHVLATIPETPVAVGIGFERVFDEHGHTTFSAVVLFRILAGWSAALGLGATLEDGEWDTPRPSLHIETAYEWSFGAFHLGPTAELAIDLDEAHVTLGVHLGVGI